MRGQSRAARCRVRESPGRWRVRARIERFSEPVLLLLLRERPAHGYELLEALSEQLGERVDMGNLYRAMRALERDGLVESEWRSELPGPARRIYALTDAGGALLDQWAEALRSARGTVDAFLDRHAQGRR